MIIDTHCHLNDDTFSFIIEDVIKDAKEKHVEKFIVPGWDKSSSYKAVELAHKYECIYAAIGLHPENITDDQLDLSWIEELANDSKVIAIGEIGLDYHFRSDNKDIQKEVFIKQIEIAKKLNLPYIVHTRDAIEETYNVVLSSNYYNGVVHCYTGSLEMAKRFLKLGMYLGIGGVLTFKNTNLKDTLKDLGLERILTETDSPYLAPVPNRGKTNCPAYLEFVLAEMSNLLGIPVNEIEDITRENAEKLFNI